jgi:SAM-dependent methyltransferase
MPLSFFDFLYLGSDQWRVMENPLVKAFFRLFGPLGTHARIRNARVLNALLEQKIDLRESQILDIGSGYGYSLNWLARRFPGAKLDGYELDSSQVVKCQKIVRSSKRSNLSFHQGTIEDVEQEDCYDVVISIDVLEHIDDDLGTLKGIRRVLKPGGMVVMHIPLRHQLQKRIFPIFQQHTQFDHVRDEYLAEEITEKVVLAGLSIVSFEYGFGTLGELSFELNNLFWSQRLLRNITAVLFWPASIVLGYFDTVTKHTAGNSMVIVARK